MDWSTKWTKVKAHTGSQIGHYFGNFRADELANRGANKDLILRMNNAPNSQPALSSIRVQHAHPSKKHKMKTKVKLKIKDKGDTDIIPQKPITECF
jgi:hypothetical protein